MKDRYIILLTTLIVIVQTTVLHLFRIMDVAPNLMLLWLIIAIVLFGRFVGIKTAIYAGVLTDILIGKGLGVHLFIYLLIAIIISSIEEKIFKDNYVTPLILIVSTTLFYHSFMSLVHYFSTGQFEFFEWVFEKALVEVLYNVAIGLVVYTKAFRWYMGYQMR